MLAKTWIEEKLYTLLARMQSSPDTMEINIEVSEMGKNGVTIWLSWVFTERTPNSTHHRDAHQIIACTIAVLWNQPRLPTTEEEKRKMQLIFFRHKERSFIILRKWMQVEIIILSKLSWSPKDKYVFSFLWFLDYNYIKSFINIWQ